MIKKVPVKEKGLVRVAFELPSAVWAERVNVMDEFNDWHTMSTPMTRERADASWMAIVELETGRRYRFRHVVGGKEGFNDWHLTSVRGCFERAEMDKALVSMRK
jgi:1,4-alpha-glucan branching enzyme